MAGLVIIEVESRLKLALGFIDHPAEVGERSADRAGYLGELLRAEDDKRTRELASSIRSIALSGRKRSEM